ncbi:MAG: hypothetical protein ABL933_15320 [Methyloglobulus sp.]|nr:hypothetical protein [Methyloglobulus sp.]
MTTLGQNHDGPTGPYPDFSPLYEPSSFSWWLFSIVVSSVAIKEGVSKSLQMTELHFKEHYDNTPTDYFVYDSQKLAEVRSFATNDAIQVMVINIDAFRKSFTDPEKEDKANIIHRPNDRMNGMKPIDFIRDKPHRHFRRAAKRR